MTAALPARAEDVPVTRRSERGPDAVLRFGCCALLLSPQVPRAVLPLELQMVAPLFRARRARGLSRTPLPTIRRRERRGATPAGDRLAAGGAMPGVAAL